MIQLTPRRAGLTLLEVVVAMAIFFVAVIAIYQLISISNDRALDVQLQTRTSMRCQSKLAEATVGALSLQSTGGYSAFDDDKDLQWRMEVTDMGFTGVYQVKISVKADLPGGRVFETSLAQVMLDPNLRGSTLDPPPQASQSGNPTQDATGSSTSGTSGSTSGTSGTSGNSGATSGTTGGGGGGTGGGTGSSTGGSGTTGTGNTGSTTKTGGGASKGG